MTPGPVGGIVDRRNGIAVDVRGLAAWRIQVSRRRCFITGPICRTPAMAVAEASPPIIAPLTPQDMTSCPVSHKPGTGYAVAASPGACGRVVVEPVQFAALPAAEPLHGQRRRDFPVIDAAAQLRQLVVEVLEQPLAIDCFIAS